MSYEFAELVDSAVADAPPLSPVQIDKLAVLFTLPAPMLERCAA